MFEGRGKDSMERERMMWETERKKDEESRNEGKELAQEEE